jgi:hypothetical protein
MSAFRNKVSSEQKAQFREQFQRALRISARKGFAVDECFAIVWQETSEAFDFSESTFVELYQEMITWVKAEIQPTMGPPINYPDHTPSNRNSMDA